jgi:hypothetical protein
MNNLRLLFCFVGLLGALTLRAQTCEANLTSSGTQKDGLTFTSSASLRGLTSHSAIGQIKGIVASDPAFELGPDSYQSNQGTLEIRQKASGKSREFPVYFTANDQGQVTFKAVFPAGMGAQPADVGSYACGKWLDKLQTGSRGNTLAAEGEKLSGIQKPTTNESSVAPTAAGTASCQANFVTKGLIIPGGYQYMSYIFVPASSANSTLQQIKKAAEPRGYKVAEEKQVDDQEQVLLTAAPKDNPIAVSVNMKNGHVGIGMQAPQGQPMFSQAARDTLCGLLGQGTDSVAGRSEPPSQAASADRGAVPEPGSRTAAPEQQLNVLRPSGMFDLAGAKAALEQGSSTIRGTGCIRRAGNLILAKNQHVYLYPDTQYLKEAMALIKKARHGKDRLDIDPAAISTRMDGMTNSQGEFQFSRMKPGAYYLITTMQSAITGVQDINNGSSQTGADEITFYHTLVPYTNHFDDVLDKDVIIKGDAETVDITLTSHIKWSTVFVMNSQSHAGVFGCRDGHGLW